MNSFLHNKWFSTTYCWKQSVANHILSLTAAVEHAILPPQLCLCDLCFLCFFFFLSCLSAEWSRCLLFDWHSLLLLSLSDSFLSLFLFFFFSCKMNHVLISMERKSLLKSWGCRNTYISFRHLKLHWKYVHFPKSWNLWQPLNQIRPDMCHVVTFFFFFFLSESCSGLTVEVCCCGASSASSGTRAYCRPGAEKQSFVKWPETKHSFLKLLQKSL